MATSSHNALPALSMDRSRVPLRLVMATPPLKGTLAGAWWPQSRVLQDEAADLVDHFPESVGRVSRLIFSPPDRDNSSVGQRGVRQILAARGHVKVGAFPRDDTHVMIVTLSSGQRLRLSAIPPDAPDDGGNELLLAAGCEAQ